MVGIAYVVSIKDKLDTSNKAAKFIRDTLNCRNTLARGYGGLTGGYLFIAHQDVNYRWGRIRHVRDIFHSWMARDYNLVFLDSGSDFIGVL